MKFLHCFADEGVESEVLAAHGDVIRIGIDARDTNESVPIKADANHLPFSDDVRFDLGLFHPPCTKWCDMPSADTENAPDLIPLARDIAKRHCDHYIIENKPRAPLDDPVYLEGGMFGLPYKYERAFETSFPVEQPPRQRTFGYNKGQPFFNSEYSKEWWAVAKGYSARYTKDGLSKNGTPRVMLEYLLLAWIEATDDEDRPDYSDYDRQMSAKRAAAANQSLEVFATGGGV